MALENVTVADKAHVMYVGTEDHSAEAYMPFPLRLEVIHRTKRDDPATESVVQWYFVDAPGADAVKDYHDYVVKFERPVPGFVGFRVYWFGRAFSSVWLDQVKLLEEPLPSEAQQLNGVKLDGQLHVSHQQPLTLVCSGPYDWAYHLPDAIGGQCGMAPGTMSAAGLSSMPALPDTTAGFSKYDAVLLSEVELGSYTAKQRLLLSEFVKSGGGLVLLGGMLGYGKSQVHVSPLLMDMLPVVTKGRWDLRKAPAGGL